MKFVFDTSVLIASFYQLLNGPSFSRQVYDFVVSREKVYISDQIMKEFSGKCKLKLGMSLAQTLSLEKIILEKADWIDLDHNQFKNHTELRDKNDEHILNLSAIVKADVLLTWDKDLLSLKKRRGLKILTPREFWDSLPELA